MQKTRAFPNDIVLRAAMLSVVAFAMLAVQSHSASTSSLISFLSAYTKSAASIVQNSIVVNITVSNKAYTLLWTNTSRIYGNAYLLVNTTSQPYGFVTDNATASLALGNYLISKYYPNQSTISFLNATMNSYINSSKGSINQCLTETGFNNGLCTKSSSNIGDCIVAACQSVPVCKAVLANFHTQSSFSYGLQNFSFDYVALSDNYSRYFSALSGMNSSNVGNTILNMEARVSAISAQSVNISENALFPPPSSIPLSQVQSVCANYGPSDGPWYCYATGFCEATTYNASILDSLDSRMAAILATPITAPGIKGVVGNTIANNKIYYEPVYVASQSAAYNAFLNSTLTPYASLVSNMTFVSSRFNDPKLSNSLAVLSSTFNSIRAQGINQNITLANQIIRSAMANSLAVYVNTSSVFLPTYNLALNNTRLILRNELDYMSVPYYVAALASKEDALNAQMTGKLNATTLAGLRNDLQDVNNAARALSAPASASGELKMLLGGPVSSVLGATGGSVPQKTFIGPVYVAVLAFVAFAIIIGVIYYYTYHQLAKKGRIRNTPKVHRAWTIIFASLFVIAILLSLGVYSYAAKANSFLPFEGFTLALKGSKAVFLLVNSTISANASVGGCMTLLQHSLAAQGKTVYYGTLTGYSCSVPSNSIVTGSSCLDRILGSGTPVIIIYPNTTATITYKGFYGTALYVPRAYGSMPTCAVQSVLVN